MVKTGTGKRLMALILSFALCFSQPITAFALEEGGEQAEESVSEPLLTPEEAESSEPEAETPPEQPEEGSTGEEPETEQTGDPFETEPLQTLDEGVPTAEEALRQAAETGGDFTLTEDITLSGDLTLGRDLMLSGPYKLTVPVGVTLELQRDRTLDVNQGELAVEEGGRLRRNGWLIMHPESSLTMGGSYESGNSCDIILHADGFNVLPAVTGIAPGQMQVHKNCTELSELYEIFDVQNSPFRAYGLTVGKIRGRDLTLTGEMNIPQNALLNIEYGDGYGGEHLPGSLTLSEGAALTVDGGVSVFDGCTLSCPAGAAVELRGFMEWYNAVNDGSVTLAGNGHLNCRGESFTNNGSLLVKDEAFINVPGPFLFTNNGSVDVNFDSRVNFDEDTTLAGNGTWTGRGAECTMWREVSDAAELLEAVWQLNGGAEGHRDIALCNSITVTAADLDTWAETHPENDWGGKVRFIGEYYLRAVNNAPGITLTVEPGISTYGRENRADLSFGLNVTLGGESETYTHFYVGAEQEGDVRTLRLTGTLNTYGHLDISREGALTVAEGGSLCVQGDGMQINGAAAVEEGGSFIAQYDTNVNINDEGSLTNNGSFALQNNARLHTSGCFINNGSVSVEEDCEFNHNGGTLENHGEWNGREPNRNLREEVSTAAELVAAVSRMNAEEANCKELILRQSITLNGSDLPAEWEGCLTLIGDYQLRSDTEEGQPPYTLTLNCDLLTESVGEGYDCHGSLVLLCNLVLKGDFRANSYLRIAPDWGEDRSATLTLVSGHSMKVTGDMDISPLGSLVIEEGAALTVNYHCGIWGELCNNGTVNVAGEGYAELQEEGRYEGDGQWNGNPLAQNQWRAVSTAAELLEAVEEMNAGPIGGRTLHLQSSITVPDGEPLILVGDYNIQAERENYTLTLRRPTEIVGDEIGHASLNLRTNIAVENSFSADCWYQLGDWGEEEPKGHLTVQNGGSLLLGNGMLFPGSTVELAEGCELTLRSFMNCSGALTVNGSLLLEENGSMDVYEGGSLKVSGTVESRAWNPNPIFVHGDSCEVRVPAEAESLLGYELDFELIEELAAFAEEWHPGYYRLVYSGVGELTEDLTLSANYQLCLPGTDYRRLCKLTVAEGVTLDVHNLSVAGELYIEEGATLLADGEVWIVQDYYQLLTNNGSVELADTAHLSFDGHIINNGSFINNGFTDFNGWLEGEGRWETRGGVNVTRWAQDEQELIELVNDLNNWGPDASRMIRFTLPITLTQALTLRGDYRFGTEGDAQTSLTVAEGGSLTIEGRYEYWGGRDGALAMEIPLTVEAGASLHFDAEHFSYLQMDGQSGSLRVYGEVDFGDCGKINVNESVEVDGLPRSAYELCLFDIRNEATLRAAIAAHEADGGPTRMVYNGSDLGEATLTLNNDLYIPGNMVLEIAGWNGFRHELIIPEGKKLSLGEGGRLCVYWNGALTVEGTLDCSVGHFECENWEDFHLAENGSYLPNVGDVEAQVLEGMRNGWGWVWDCEMELTLHEDAEVRGYFPFIGKSRLIIPEGVTLTVTPGSELFNDGTDIVIQRGGCLINGGKMNLSRGSLTVEEGGTYTDLPDSMLAVRLYAAAVEGIGDRFSYYAACESTEDIKALLAEELACRGKGIVLEGAVTLTESLTLGENIELFLNGMEDKPCVLTIPNGVTLTIEGLLTLPPESAIIVEDGGTLILEESSSFMENGALTVAEGGTLIRRGFTSISRDVSSEEELLALLAQTADIGYDRCRVDLTVNRSLTLGDVDFGGINGAIFGTWDEEARETTFLTVTGHWQNSGELEIFLPVEFTEGSLLDNSGRLLVCEEMTVNGGYKGHYDGYENGWLIQPFALSGETEGNVFIYGESIRKNVTLSAAIPGEDPQAALKDAIANYAPAVSGCGELELFGAEAPCIEITEEITLPAGVRLVLASDTLIIRDGGKLINAEGAQVVLNPDSSLTIDEGGTFDSYEGMFYHLGGEFINNGTYIPNKETQKCGDSVYWTLDEDGLLTISGTGRMWDYGYTDAGWQYAPWYYLNVTSVVIEEGITHIGDFAFYCCDTLTSVTIPNSVTSIGDWAFAYCFSLTSITIPESVTSIGIAAFEACSSVTSITIPESVTSIGYDAFDGCSSLTIITIPKGVTSIGDGAFDYCDSLTSIDVAEGNQSYSSKDGVLFDKAQTTLIRCPGGMSGIYSIPNSVESIGDYAFEDCSGLTSITIPASVTSIGGGAFSGCISLTSITIPESVTSIGGGAFSNCISLTSITIPNSVTSIGKYAFYRCSSLTSITIPESVTSIGGGAFSNCSSLTSVTIPNSVTSIGIAAFDYCDSLTDIYYSGSEAQWNAIDMGEDAIPEGVTIHYNYVPDPCATGHDWDAPTYAWSEDYSECTATRVCKNDPTHTDTATATVTGEITKPATCEEPGEKTYTATFAEDWAETRTCTAAISADGHDWAAPTYAWSEDKSECTAKRVCKNDPTHTDTATATVTGEITKPATCEEPGEKTYTATFAEDWAEEQTATAAITATGHDWDDATYAWSEDKSSCTAKRICKNDPAHSESATATVTDEVTKPATCEEPGEKTYTATFAEEWAEEQTCTAAISATGHDWGEVTYAWSEDKSSCTAKRVCKNDPAHSESATATVTDEVTKPATCEEPGEKTYTATFAEDWAETRTATAAITATGHDWDAPTYAWSEDKSSCTATRICKNDPAHTETATATVTDEVTKPATCEEPGEKTYTATFAEEWASEQTTTEPITATGHDWAAPTYAWSEDKSSCTAKRVCKNDPAHTESATATVTDEVTKPATCEEPGEKTYTATFAKDWAEEQTCTAAITATGHDWDDATYALSEDKSSCTAKRICKNDPAHSESATATVIPYITDAGCETPGEAVYEATFAEEWAETRTATETLPALGHNWVFDRVDDSSVPYYNVFRCENCKGTKAEEVPTPKAVRVELDCEAEETVYLNDTDSLTLHADVLPGNAAPEVAWTGMNTAYATFVQIGNDLAVTNFTGKTGTLTLTATAQDGSKVKSSVKLTFARRAESINILDSKGNDIEEYTLKGKQSYTFKTSIAADKSVTDKTLLWETDSDYVTVDAKGKVTVKSFAGEEITACLTVATAADPSVTDSITLHLSPNLSQSINIVADGERVNDLTLPVNIADGGLQLYAELVALEGDVVWSSSSTKIATVNSDGTVELKGTGTVTVTAAVGKVKGSVKLSVVRYVESITVPEGGTVAAGKSVTFTATVEPANASNKTLNWSLEEGDELYATLSKGKLTAAKTLASPRTVTVHVDSADGCACAKFPVTLMPIATAVQIDGVPEGDVDFSESVKLTAEIEPLTASRSVKWSSSNKSYAIDEDGYITVADNAKSATVTFTATAQDGSGKKATAKIKFVRLMQENDLTLAESVGVGSGKSVTVPYEVNKAVTNQKLTWTLSDSTYATCKNNVVTAKKGLTEPVDVVLTATAQDGSGVSKSCVVTIYPIATAVQIEGVPEGEVDFSEALTLSAVVEPANALQSVKWSSSNKSFAIDEYGNITVADNAKAATVTFTATAADGSGKKATAKIKFVRLMRDEDLTLSEMASVATGKAVTVKYTVNKAVTNQKLTWTLDDTTYATCKNNVVTAKKTVTAPQPVYLVATAQDGSGISKRCRVTIYPITTAVKLFDGGTEVTGKTVDFDGFAALDVVNTPDNAMASWTVKSSNSAVQVSMEGNMLYAWIAESKTLKPGTKVTVTVTAADGSGKSAKVILNAVEAE